MSSKKSLDSVLSIEETLEGKEVPKQPTSALLFISCLGMCIQSFIFGMGIGIPNNSKPAMIYAGAGTSDSFTGASTFDPPLDEGDFNTCVSIFAVGGMIGALSGGLIVDKLGPKGASIFVGDILFIIAGCLQGFANGYTMLLAGRICLGLGIGVACNTVPVYNNDIAPVHLRGAFGIFHQFFVTFGILAANVIGMQALMGTPSSVWMIYFSCAPLAVIHGVVMFMLPESPAYLYKSGKESEAAKALQSIRGGSYDVSAEMDEMRTAKDKSNEGGEIGFVDALKLLFSKYWRQNMIGIMLQVGQQLSGINAIMFYSNTILGNAGFSDAELATVIVSAVNVISTFPAFPLIERKGRRFLLMGGFGLMGCANLAFMLCLTFGANTAGVVFMMIGVFFFAIGPGPVPWMVAPEILPPSIASVGISLSVFTNWLFTFIVGYVYPILEEAVTTYSFLPFAVSCFLITAFTFFFVPETKGKTYSEIEKLFGN